MARTGWLVIILLLATSATHAATRVRKVNFQGYVLNSGAFSKINSFCVDTHNLPPDQVKLINHLVARESRGKGLLTRLPWHERPTCDEPGIDAMVRLEFPHDPPLIPFQAEEVEGVLLLLRPGSPTPIYETPAVSTPACNCDTGIRFIAELLQYNAARYAVLILIHDWFKRQAPAG